MNGGFAKVMSPVAWAIGLALLLAIAGVPQAAFAAGGDGAPAQVAQQVKGKNITGKANTKTLFTYTWSNGGSTSAKKTVKAYDVTGDKKADTVKIVVSGASSAGYGTKSLKLSVNGKKVRTFTDNGGVGTSASVQLITLKNGRSFLYVKYTGNNADGTYKVLQCRKGTWRTVVSDDTVPSKFTTGHRYIESVKASGNKLVVTYFPMTYTAGMLYLKYTYACNAKGVVTLAKTGKVYTAKDYGNGVFSSSLRTASTAMQAYTSYSKKTPKFTIYSGNKVQFLKCRMTKGTLMFQVKSSGQTGWIEAASTYGPHNGTCFEETGLAG